MEMVTGTRGVGKVEMVQEESKEAGKCRLEIVELNDRMKQSAEK